MPLFAKGNPKVSNRTAALASFILAFASLYFAVYHIQVLISLLENGKRAEGIVTEIHRGVKTSKWAVYRFETGSGETITGRDLFQLYIRRPGKGDHVTVIYDPSDPGKVTAELGLWTWQGPVIFFTGFIMLGSLGIAILIYKPGKRKQ